MTDQPTFTLDQAIAAQRALRSAAGLAPEQFPLSEFVGMISDEIDQMRLTGHPDQVILRIIKHETGQDVTLEQLRAHYAPIDRRHPG